MIFVLGAKNRANAGGSEEALFRTRTGDPFLTMEGTDEPGSRPESSRVARSACTSLDSASDSGHPRTTPDDDPADAELTRTPNARAG